ncbi:MAG TPA: hypothetical protein VLV89_04325 [Candidatus Acidoferrum sp.]|nr:hypothetical protein [Candidatus Acidoferrum sp.]
MGLAAGASAARQQTPPAQAAPPVQTPPPAQQQSLGDAARKAREQEKNAPHAAKTYTNEDLGSIHAGGISTVGSTSAPAAGTGGAPEGTAKPDKKKTEADWRKKFADARLKLELAQKDLDIMQRELAVLNVQYYPDPNQAMQQQHDRSDINDKLQKIEDKKAEVAKLEQAITDLHDELRRAGGDPSWAY